MKIKCGYNEKETEIKIYNQGNGHVELWIREEGKDNRESLGYMTANELRELFREVQRAGKELFE